MNLHVLGCAGGIGGRERFTTCMRIDDDILIDAGTGLTSLGVEELIKIDHVFITHGHLDHVAGLALLVDAIQGKKTGKVTVHATVAIIDLLKKNLFNWALWPDFTEIPNRSNPVFCWEPMEHGATVELDGRMITSYPVNHTVGSAGYLAYSGESGFLFTGDMCTTPELWAALMHEKKLSKVIVDCSFPNADCDLAARSMHYCPRSLIEDIGAMPDTIEFLIYHLKPGQEDQIMHELQTAPGNRAFTALKCGDRFGF